MEDSVTVLTPDISSLTKSEAAAIVGTTFTGTRRADGRYWVTATWREGGVQRQTSTPDQPDCKGLLNLLLWASRAPGVLAA